jgi:hypothetical protein
MSQEYAGEDPNVIAKRAEQDLNSDWAKHGHRSDDASKGQTHGQGGQGAGVSGRGPGQYGGSDSTKVNISPPTLLSPGCCGEA